MSKIFLHIFDWMEKHQPVLYASLLIMAGVFGWGISKLSFDEDVMGFFASDESVSAPSGLKMADRIIISISADDVDEMIEAADVICEDISPWTESGDASLVTGKDSRSLINDGARFIYDHLPIYMDEEDYERVDSLLNENNVRASVAAAAALSRFPFGNPASDIVRNDPLNVGTPLLRMYMRFSDGNSWREQSGYFFTPDMSSLLMFIEPSQGMGNTGANDGLVSAIESAVLKVEQAGVEVGVMGGPVIAVHNARQIKKDAVLTLGVALIVILIVISLAFRSRWAVPLILLPPVFGALAALGVIGFTKETVSAISVGVGAVVMGVALSYSIHVVSHRCTQPDPRKIISELASPLTIGCFTTIGAFVALIFTRSPLLRDMGLFASLTLVGTTLFSLVYFPHMLGKIRSGHPGRLLKWIDRVNAYPLHDNRLVVAFVAAAALLCLFAYRDVRFNEDMSAICYMPDEIVQAEASLADVIGNEDGHVYMVTSADDLESACESYSNICRLCSVLADEGRIDASVSVEDFIVPEDVQRQKILKWNEFWASRAERTLDMVRDAAVSAGLPSDAFAGFGEMLAREYEVCRFEAEDIRDVPLLSDWMTYSGDKVSILTRISVDDADKPYVYEAVEKIGGTTVLDAGYMSEKMAADTVADFDYLLWICALLVFCALLLSYGRLELAVITFVPMCVSWVIILGLMAVLDIRFNVVNIILASFIFGLGDDFSIFIMDGLIDEYKTGRKALGVHKTAIFFSAFTAVAGLGAMMLARHPALKSIGLISVLGLSVVVLVSYTIQPFLFRLLVSKPASRKGFPHTILSLLHMTYVYSFFFIGCVIARLYMLLLFFVPIRKDRKRRSLQYLLHLITRLYVKAMFAVRKNRENPYAETFEKPAVVIANHQSFIDIILMLSLSPKLLMVTNDWVWNSPFFGRIIRYAGFFHTSEGYENMTERIRQRVSEGYSVVIFPEGTRSPDCSIQRFHKGAFLLAQTLELDVVPVLIYGAGHVSSKRQGFYIKRGMAMTKILKRVAYGDTAFGSSYQEQAKAYRKYFKEQYAQLNSRYGRMSNPYFRNALIKNYMYKGPVLEWYMRVKMRLDGYYDMWDRILPRQGVITDVGCGYGQLALALSILSPERRVYGFDYDSEKIALASHSFLAGGSVTFGHVDMRDCELPESDAFVFNDSLHYVDERTQEAVLRYCAGRLKAGGCIIVRDADASDKERHDAVKRIEKLSTEILGFNKTEESLTFVGREWMSALAEDLGMSLKTRLCDERTSETVYLLTRK